jgi:magnesium transporter
MRPEAGRSVQQARTCGTNADRSGDAAALSRRRLRKEIDALREVLAFAFEASLMAGQAQQTVITRRLAWAAILAVPTAITGIYRMNFEHMAELKWAYGYFLVIGVIVTICATLYVQFRRNGWL